MSNSQPSEVPGPRAPQMPLARLLSDLGPLILFFVAYKFAGIFVATATFMVTTVLSLGLIWWREKKIAVMPLFTAVLVLIFGSLTLIFKDATFIKMKPTILYAFFGIFLLGGLKFERHFLRMVFAQAFELDDAGWRALTWRWGLFFLTLAGLNEAVWRNTSTAAWVDFKVFAIMPLIFVFAIAQTPLVLRHQVVKDAPKTDS